MALQRSAEAVMISTYFLVASQNHSVIDRLYRTVIVHQSFSQHIPDLDHLIIAIWTVRRRLHINDFVTIICGILMLQYLAELPELMKNIILGEGFNVICSWIHNKITEFLTYTSDTWSISDSVPWKCMWFLPELKVKMWFILFLEHPQIILKSWIIGCLLFHVTGVSITSLWCLKHTHTHIIMAVGGISAY